MFISEVGRGTTFKIYLPAQATPGEDFEEGAVEETLPRGDGETILVVDDETSILSITSETLQAYGYNVLTASNGAEGVAILRHEAKENRHRPNRSLHAGDDGRATIYAILKINPKAKIIAMSGMDEAESVAKASTAGIKHFISKPYTAATLLKTLKTIAKG